MKSLKIVRIIATAVIVVIVGQTLFFKFSGAQESVDLFTKLGIEPFGRIGIGIAELIALILLLIPRTAVFGAIGAAGLMAGAILSHLTKLGFEGDYGLLAGMAAVALVASLLVLWILRVRIPIIGKFFLK